MCRFQKSSLTYFPHPDSVWIELRKLAIFRELPGLVLNPKMEFGANNLEWCWDWGWGSWKCRCQMSMPDCTPVDGWDTILVCDNVNGVEDLGMSKVT